MNNPKHTVRAYTSRDSLIKRYNHLEPGAWVLFIGRFTHFALSMGTRSFAYEAKTTNPIDYAWRDARFTVETHGQAQVMLDEFSAAHPEFMQALGRCAIAYGSVDEETIAKKIREFWSRRGFKGGGMSTSNLQEWAATLEESEEPKYSLEAVTTGRTRCDQENQSNKPK